MSLPDGAEYWWPRYARDRAESKECIKNFWRVLINGEVMKEGPHAMKQTAKIKDRIVLVRKFNITKNCWHDKEWKPYKNPFDCLDHKPSKPPGAPNRWKCRTCGKKIGRNYRQE